MNESFVHENSMVNGISYSVKNRSALIKIWTKDYKYDIKEKLPSGLLSRFDNLIKSHSSNKKFESFVNVRYTEIKPEYEITPSNF